MTYDAFDKAWPRRIDWGAFMTLYLVAHVDDEFRWIGPLDGDKEAQQRLGRVRFEAVRESWVAIQIGWLPETVDRAISDFPTFWVGVLAVSRRAREVLNELLEPAGEFLPLDGLNGEYVGYHCLRTQVAVDEAETEKALKQTAIRSFASPTFLPVLQKKAIDDIDVFRLPQSFGKLFVSQRFKDEYERAGLSGLDFRAVSLT